jgi:competence protein ComEA
VIRMLASLVVVLVVVAPLVGAHPHAQTSQSKPEGRPRGASQPAGQSAAVVNLNTATVKELEALPGIGTKTAERIIDYRTKKGPFKKIEELMNVQGIGEKSFLKLRAQLTVGAKAEPNTP